MSPRVGSGHALRHAVATAAVAAGILVVSACGTDDAPGSDGAQVSSAAEKPSRALPDFKNAYAAGHKEGRRLYDSGGKGGAVREVVGGGCARRALEAGPDAEQDRGAWVKGCQDGVSDRPEHLPARPLTKREPDPGLLKEFRTWVRAHGDAAGARHAHQVFTVELTGPDYDVEVTTDYTSRAKAKEFADAFVGWWDGDDGHGVARSLIILDSHGRRIAIKQL